MQKIGRYEIIEEIGRGGMAIVYKAFDPDLARHVAIKVIRKGAIPEEQHERLLKRFEREAKAQGQLKHPNIVQVMDTGKVDDLPYLVMELAEGGTLKSWLGEKIPYQEAVAVVAPIADALTYAHSKGVLHRDVKPSNILFTVDGRPVLADFGIAKLLETDDATLTGTGLGVGTPEYMAPEQWKGESGPQTDVYALGVVLYEMVTGQKPYTAKTPAEIVVKQVTEGVRSPREFDETLTLKVEKVILDALAVKPEDRFRDMTEFSREMISLLPKDFDQIKAVRRISGVKIVSDQEEESVTEDIFETDNEGKEKRGKARRMVWWVAGVIVILAALGFGGYILATSPDSGVSVAGFSFARSSEVVILTEEEIMAITALVTPTSTQKSSTLTPDGWKGTSTALYLETLVDDAKQKTTQRAIEAPTKTMVAAETQEEFERALLSEVKGMLSEKLNYPLFFATDISDFRHLGNQWVVHSPNKNYQLENGEIILEGIDFWATSLVRNDHSYIAGEGVLVLLKYESDSFFSVSFDQGEWEDNSYKSWGLYITSEYFGESNMFTSSIYKNGNQIGGNKFPGNLSTISGEWYYVFLGIFDDQFFSTLIWRKENQDNYLYLNQQVSGFPEENWRFSIGGTEGKLVIDTIISIQFVD